MLKIWELKKAANSSKSNNTSRISAAQLRLQGDLNSLELPPEMAIDFSNPSDILHFTLTYIPTSGIYEGGKFEFLFTVGLQYPIEPPKVRLNARIWHPNIDHDGALCLNILREDWKPVLSLSHVAMGIQFLFLEPNKNDPLNRDAAASMQANAAQFANEVRCTMRGESLHGLQFDNVMC